MVAPIELSIRDATSTDLEACAHIIAAEGRDVVTTWMERFREALKEPERRFLSAQTGGEIVGFGHLRRVERGPDSGELTAPAGWYLSGVTVAASHRRRGIGQRLTEERIRLLRGVAECVYYVADPGNAATLAMHRRRGFVYMRDVALPDWEHRLGLHGLDLSTRAR